MGKVYTRFQTKYIVVGPKPIPFGVAHTYSIQYSTVYLQYMVDIKEYPPPPTHPELKTIKQSPLG